MATMLEGDTMGPDKDEGVAALNQEFKKFDQVDKEQSYRLAEQAGEEVFDEAFEIQVCDMAQLFAGGEEGRAKFDRELGEAMADIGFAILVNHGIDPELFTESNRRITEFFEDLTSRERRMDYRAQRHGSVNQGYFPIRETSDIHPDLVEGWVFCRRAFNWGEDPEYKESDYWPVAEQEPFFRKVCVEYQELVLPLMQSILRHLGVDPHLYDQRLKGSNFGLRFNYYPPISDSDDASGAGRILGHEDVDLFTILPAPELEGLQVLHHPTNKWVRLRPPPGSIILNTGDYMQRITNDRLASTTHRVAKPRDRSLFAKARISLPMAVYVWEDEILEVLPGCGEPKYEPISAIKFHTHCTSKFYGEAYAVDNSSEDS